jgi:site-specific DNA-methyltransferase (adenine-specific)
MAQKDNSEIIQENIVLHGDCLELMKDIDDKSIDMILCDLPYGMTRCKWDTVIPFEPLWVQYKRIIKDRGAIVFTASQPFASALIMSNPEMFKYEWIWKKEAGTGFFHAKHQPLRITESIFIFSKSPAIKCNCSMNYIPQMRKGKPYSIKKGSFSEVYGSRKPEKLPITVSKGDRYPINFLEFKRDKDKLHPTQKPVALFEYLIKTYTNEGDLVLDNCAGSGTTAIACMNTGRDYILMEKEQKHIDIINERIAKHRKQLTLKM